MEQIKFYVTLNVHDRYLEDNMYDETFKYIREMVQEIADGFDGYVEDLEIK